MRKLNPSSAHPDRAVQMWQILTAAAMQRQTLTYEILAQKVYQRDAQGVLNQILGHIAFYCIENDLPLLTVLVVNKGTGQPGWNIPADRTPGSIDQERERVYATDWYDIYPPNAQELAAAMASHRDHFTAAA
jgi:hypothetical protein